MDDVWRRNLFLTFPAERCFIIPWNSRSREPLDTDIINQVKLLFCEVEGGHWTGVQAMLYIFSELLLYSSHYWIPFNQNYSSTKNKHLRTEVCPLWHQT